MRKFLCFLALSLVAQVKNVQAQDERQVLSTLSNGKVIPLVGMGVGNLEHELVVPMISEAVGNSELNYRLIDTTRNNERLVREGIEKALDVGDFRSRAPHGVEIHVVTKVWYTHLGYDRTILSVKNSLENLRSEELEDNIKVHVLLHWPRCEDHVSLEICEESEQKLPQEVKDAGPSPLEDVEGAFLSSWRALENIYTGEVDLGSHLPELESIGVSNFQLEDLQKLEDNSRFTPHILQHDFHAYLEDMQLTVYCRQKRIHFQAHSVLEGILYSQEHAPNALGAITKASVALSKKGGVDVSPAQLLLRLLITIGVSVIPRMSSVEHLRENSFQSLNKVPRLDKHDLLDVRDAALALKRREDVEHPVVTIHNKSSKAFEVHWLDEDETEKVLVHENLQPGESFRTQTQRGHQFVASAVDKTARKVFKVNAGFGKEQDFHLEEEL